MKTFYMKKAIELALKGSGFVSPNPLSGAVIVKEGRIIGECYHHKSNRSTPIMIEALQLATENTWGSEAYLNIEPNLMNYPSDAFIQVLKASGIKKMYIGIEEPLVKCKGEAITLLKKCGIEIELGILKQECQELNEIYAYYSQTHMPFVFVKWAMTLDGKLASKTGDSKWISSDESLQFVHHLRQKVAAIMVGEGTVKLDNPQLTTRLEGVEISNPLRVILSKYGDIEDSVNVLKVDEFTKTLIIASAQLPFEREKYLLKRGVQVIKLQEVEGRIDFQEIVKVLGEMEIDSLYIEGGSSVLGSAFESGIIHKVYVAVAPKIIGGKTAVTPVAGGGIERMRDAIVLKNVSHEIIGHDVIIKGYMDKDQ